MIEVKIDKKDVEAAINVLSTTKKGAQTVVNRAINRALMRGRTVASKSLRGRYTIKASDVKKATRLRRPGGTETSGQLVFSGPELTMAHFRIRPSGRDTTGNNRQLVRVEVERTGLKPLKNAFVYNGTVFQRKGASRLPIEPRYGPSVPQMVGNENITEGIQSEMRDTFLRRIDHEAMRLIKGDK